MRFLSSLLLFIVYTPLLALCSRLLMTPQNTKIGRNNNLRPFYDDGPNTLYIFPGSEFRFQWRSFIGSVLPLHSYNQYQVLNIDKASLEFIPMKSLSKDGMTRHFSEQSEHNPHIKDEKHEDKDKIPQRFDLAGYEFKINIDEEDGIVCLVKVPNDLPPGWYSLRLHFIVVFTDAEQVHLLKPTEVLKLCSEDQVHYAIGRVDIKNLEKAYFNNLETVDTAVAGKYHGSHSLRVHCGDIAMWIQPGWTEGILKAGIPFRVHFTKISNQKLPSVTRELKIQGQQASQKQQILADIYIHQVSTTHVLPCTDTKPVCSLSGPDPGKNKMLFIARLNSQNPPKPNLLKINHPDSYCLVARDPVSNNVLAISNTVTLESSPFKGSEDSTVQFSRICNDWFEEKFSNDGFDYLNNSVTWYSKQQPNQRSLFPKKSVQPSVLKWHQNVASPSLSLLSEDRTRVLSCDLPAEGLIDHGAPLDQDNMHLTTWTSRMLLASLLIVVSKVDFKNRKCPTYLFQYAGHLVQQRAPMQSIPMHIPLDDEHSTKEKKNTRPRKSQNCFMHAWRYTPLNYLIEESSDKMTMGKRQFAFGNRVTMSNPYWITLKEPRPGVVWHPHKLNRISFSPGKSRAHCQQLSVVVAVQNVLVRYVTKQGEVMSARYYPFLPVGAVSIGSHYSLSLTEAEPIINLDFSYDNLNKAFSGREQFFIFLVATIDPSNDYDRNSLKVIQEAFVKAFNQEALETGIVPEVDPLQRYDAIKNYMGVTIVSPPQGPITCYGTDVTTRAQPLGTEHLMVDVVHDSESKVINDDGVLLYMYGMRLNHTPRF